MKRVLILIVLMCLLIGLQAEDMIYKVLDNGLEVIVKRNTTNSSAAVYGFVKTGSNTEEQYLGAGISHYLEHLVSSGTTTKRAESDYTETYEKLGLTSNAYTTANMTAYYITGEATHTDTMISMVGEFLQHCVFSQEEVDREKQVILKEMIMRSTDVSNVVHEWENACQYPVTNSIYPVIGYPELYKKLTRDDLVSYYNRHYVPNNTIFIVIGNFDPASAMSKIETELSGWERGFYPPALNPAQGSYGGEFTYTSEFPLNNAKVTINYIIPEEQYSLSAELSAAMDILFSKRTSPINYRLVEEEKLVNYIYGYTSAVPSMRRDNPAAIVFEPRNVEDIDRIIDIIDEELAKAVDRGFEQKDLESFLNREKASRILREVTPNREANSLAWSYYLYNQPDMMKIELEALENIDLEEMTEAVSEILIPKLRVITKALPETEVTETAREDFAQAEFDLKMDRIELNKDVTLLYREEDHKEVVYFNAHFPIHQDWETTENAGIMQMITDLLLKGSKKYDALEISEWFEDHVVDFDVSINYDGLMISVKCLTGDLDEALAIFTDGFNRPSFDEKEIELLKNQLQAGLQRNSTTAGYQHRVFRNGVLYPNTRHGMKDSDVVDLQMAYTKEDLIDAWDNYFKINKDVVIAINGDISKEEASATAESFIKNLRSGKVKADRNLIVIPETNQLFPQEYDYEQVNVNINLPAPETTSPDFKVMTVINILMNRMNGGLHEATRGVNDLAYFASANYSASRDYGYMRLTSQTSINKKDELVEVLQQEIDKLKTTEIAQSEIQQALMSRKMMLRNYITAPSIGRYRMYDEIRGLESNWFDNEFEELLNVSAEDIQRVAKKYFENKIVIVSYPSEDFERTIE